MHEDQFERMRPFLFSFPFPFSFPHISPILFQSLHILISSFQNYFEFFKTRKKWNSTRSRIYPFFKIPDKILELIKMSERGRKGLIIVYKWKKKGAEREKREKRGAAAEPFLLTFTSNDASFRFFRGMQRSLFLIHMLNAAEKPAHSI